MSDMLTITIIIPQYN